MQGVQSAKRCMGAEVFFFSLGLLLQSVLSFLDKNARHYYLLLRFNSRCFSPAVIFQVKSEVRIK